MITFMNIIIIKYIMEDLEELRKQYEKESEYLHKKWDAEKHPFRKQRGELKEKISELDSKIWNIDERYDKEFQIICDKYRKPHSKFFKWC